MLSLTIRNLFSRNKRFIGGNWKCNNTLEQSTAIVANNLNKLEYNANNVGSKLVYPRCHCRTRLPSYPNCPARALQ